jgi:hypothetical protein
VEGGRRKEEGKAIEEETYTRIRSVTQKAREYKDIRK